MACPSPQMALGYLQGASDCDALAIEAHVDQCSHCREWFAHLVGTSLGVAATVEADDEPTSLNEYLAPGVEVGRYVLGESLGQGGMGIVYEARDPALDRAVAIKVLRSVLADHASARLVAEARAMAQLSHPNVRQIFDVGEVAGRVFLAMEFIDGVSLESWLHGQRRHTSEIIDAFIDAGVGLCAAHELGIVHRDFKPSNVLVTQAGRFVVTDFGLATSVGATSDPEGGTPAYMAPEQGAGGEDARVDQYAFAVSLDLALRDRAKPRGLQRALARARATDPDRRFPSMQALLRALRPPRRWRWAGVMAGGLGVFACIWVAIAVGGAGVRAVVDDRLSDDLQPGVAAPSKTAEAGLDGQSAEAATRNHVVDRGSEARAMLAESSAFARQEQYESSLRSAEKAYLVAVEAGETTVAVQAATWHVNVLGHYLGRPQEAVTWAGHAQAALRRAGVPAKLEAKLEGAVAVALYESGDSHSAREHAAHAVALHRENPDLNGDAWDLACALRALAAIEIQLGEFRPAQDELTEVQAITVDLFGTEHIESGKMQIHWANLRRAQGRPAEALEHAERAVVIFEALGVEERLGDALAAKGIMLRRLGRIEDSLEPLSRAVAIHDSTEALAKNSHHPLGVTLADLGRCEEAVLHFRRAIDDAAAINGAAHGSGFLPWTGLAECRLDMHQLRAARGAIETALAMTGVAADNREYALNLQKRIMEASESEAIREPL